MSTKRIIILGGGFGGVKCAETLRDELPLAVAFGRSCRSGFPQNSCINGDAYWGGQQFDEVAAPIRLVWRLRHADALGNYRVEIERRWAQ